MSETVHYKGSIEEIKPRTSVSLNDIAAEILNNRGLEKASYYDDYIECLCEELREEYYYHKETDRLFKINKEYHDLDEEIIKATEIEGGYEFDLKYYNGGASFNECLTEAIRRI